MTERDDIAILCAMLIQTDHEIWANTPDIAIKKENNYDDDDDDDDQCKESNISVKGFFLTKIMKK